ncbi:hypothetical protein BgAZ_201640 [Babesia gibsoni]|uniref:Uncharacterized protein n=1 Tax=Babesia gibsoni TaxID=33632 RepID=A0AAD8LPG7_BABGI|nr:hypothetical protein BgAZ_201640 [Babesia gibsoni]
MWMLRLKEKYGKKYDVTPPQEEEDETFRRMSEENIRKICTPRFFYTDVLKENVMDPRVMKRRGLLIAMFSSFSISLVFYMWYHCYHASCSECIQSSGAPNNGEINCDFTTCIDNYFFNPKTHFEKCYYSLLFFSTIAVLFIHFLVTRLAYQIFRHSNIVQND